MNSRICVLSGAGVLGTAVLGLALYWGRFGLRPDDILGWVGALVGTAGLGLAVYGMVAGRGPEGTGPAAGSAEGPSTVRLHAKAEGDARVYQAGRDQTNNEK